MRTVSLHAFCSTKGGVGKSTLAVAWTELLRVDGRRCVLLDADLTGSSLADGLDLCSPAAGRPRGARGGRAMSALPAARYAGVHSRFVGVYLELVGFAEDRRGEGETQRSGVDRSWRVAGWQELAAEQGVEPVADPGELVGAGRDLWDDDDDFERFLATSAELRGGAAAGGETP